MKIQHMPLLSVSPRYDTAADCAYGTEKQTASFANAINRVILGVEYWDIMIAPLEKDGKVPIGLLKAEQPCINTVGQRDRSDFEVRFSVLIGQRGIRGRLRA
jgi:hypothetical protein